MYLVFGTNVPGPEWRVHSRPVPNKSSSDDENDTEDLCDTTTGSRVKRDTVSMNKPNCYWPPNPANSWPTWTHLRPVRFGNPTYGPRMQLFSSTGWHLAIYDRRNIRGSTDELDRHTFLELSYAGVPGHVRIQALENHLYLAMDTRGRLYAEPDAASEATIFIESLAGSNCNIFTYGTSGSGKSLYYTGNSYKSRHHLRALEYRKRYRD
ncbi:hypothetical protein CBL_00003 [Carabus blaptoides fortunei]